MQIDDLFFYLEPVNVQKINTEHEIAAAVVVSPLSHALLLLVVVHPPLRTVPHVVEHLLPVAVVALEVGARVGPVLVLALAVRASEVRLAVAQRGQVARMA